MVTAFASYNKGYAETLRDVSAHWVELKINAETYNGFDSNPKWQEKSCHLLSI